MSRLRRPLLSLAALAAVTLAFHGRAARADDDEPARPKGPPLEIRSYDVGALVGGRATFGIDRGPFGALSPDRVNDEGHQLFAYESEDRVTPLGAVTDLIELVKAGTPPESWEQEGTRISEQGSRRIVIRAPPSLQDRVGVVLTQLEKEVLTTVTVDVIACTGSPKEGESPPEAIARGAVNLVAAVRTHGFIDQGVVALSGAERAFLVDQGVLVAKGAKAMDPQIGVQPEGLGVRTNVTRVGEVIRLNLEAWLARVDGSSVRDVDGEKVETPAIDGKVAHTRVDLRPGEWAWASTAGDVTFAARATIHPFEDPKAWPLSLRLDAPGLAGEFGLLSMRRYKLDDLEDKPWNTRGETIHLTPSYYTPPEPPELCEPAPVYPVDSLAETVKEAIDPPSWSREGVSIDVRSWTLVVRNDERHLDAIGRFLEDLRARYMKAVRVRARVVTVPAASIPNGWAGGAIDDAAALTALPGAKVVDRGSIRMLPGTRQANVGGVMRRYLGDYDVAIADEAAIGNPMVWEVLEGLSLDVTVQRVLGGGAYTVEARIDRSAWRGSRDVPTKHGTLECPTIGLTRFRGSLVARTGETRVVSAGIYGTEGDEALFILLTLTED